MKDQKTVKRGIFIDRIALAKQGDNALGSVRPFVCQFDSYKTNILLKS